MSREVPLLASEKIKLGILIVVVLAILIPGVYAGWKAIVKNIAKDTDGYEKAMEDVEKLYYFDVMSYNEDLNTYNLAVDPEHWKGLSSDARFKYCDSCHNAIRKTQWYYKMTDEGEDPVVYFYVNNNKMAQVAYGYTTVY